MTNVPAPVRFDVSAAKGRTAPLEVVMGRAIRGHRMLLGMSRRRFANAVGLPVGAVFLLERGEMRVSAALLQDIAETFGVPPIALFSDPPYRLPPGSPAGEEAGVRDMIAAFRRIRNPDRRRALVTLARILGR